MVINFITSHSPEFQTRYKVLETSIKQYHPDAIITLVELSKLPKDKARLMLQGLEQYDHVCWIGADTELFGPIDLWQYDMVAIPHMLRPLPIDGNRPGVQHVHISGALNADFIFCNKSNSTIEMLQWLDQQCQVRCVQDPCNGFNNEQSYLSVMPFFFEKFTALRDMTYNVAYWNCVMYHFRKENGVWMTDGGPLKLFHYSGFNNNPEDMSMYQDRYKATGDVLEFFQRYQKLIS